MIIYQSSFNREQLASIAQCAMNAYGVPGAPEIKEYHVGMLHNVGFAKIKIAEGLDLYASRVRECFRFSTSKYLSSKERIFENLITLEEEWSNPNFENSANKG